MTELEQLRRAAHEAEEREVREAHDSHDRRLPNWMADAEFGALLHRRAVKRRPETAFPDYPDPSPAPARTP